MKHKTLISLIIILAVAAIDQISKYFIVQNIALNSEVEVIPGFFGLMHVRNEGVAFSFFTGVPPIYLILFVLFIMVLMLIWLYQSKNPWVIIGLSISLGGALGNLTDRILYASVIDFAHFYLFNKSMPVFNLADAFLDVGMFMMVVGELMELFGKKPDQ